MDALGDNSLPDLLINNNSDGSRIDVENCSSSAVVVFVRHTLMDGTIDDNVNDIPDFVDGQGSRDVDSSVLLKTFSELMSCASSLTVTMSHLQSLIY